MKKILLVGGGTGGHVFPLLNLVHNLNKVQSTKYKVQSNVSESTKDQILNTHCQFHWIGESDSIESKICQDNQIPFSPIVCGKLRRYFSVKTLLLPFQILVGISQSLGILLREKPSSIFSKGGYVSLPVALAGWILQIPIYLHESDSIAGLANRIVGLFSRGIFTTFDEVKNLPKEKMLGHGPLLSQELVKIQNSLASLTLRRSGKFKIQNDGGINTQILVSCGSQGSASIFDAILEILKTGNSQLENLEWHVILGIKNLDYRTKFDVFPNVTTYDFFYDQARYLHIVDKCDIVIARSGSSIFEFEALGLQMILVPHPHTGNNHQYWNAIAFEKKGHELILQKDLNRLPGVLENYSTFKKSPEKKVVDMSIFNTIAKILLK